MSKFIFGSLITTFLSWLYTSYLDKNSTIIEGLAKGFIIIILFIVLLIVVIPVIRILDKVVTYFFTRLKQRHELKDAAKNEFGKKRYEAHESCKKFLRLAHQEKTALLSLFVSLYSETALLESAQAKTKKLEQRERELYLKEEQFENIKIENRKHLTFAENKIKNTKDSVNKIVQYICDDLNNLAIKNKMPHKQINKRMFKIKKGIETELKRSNLDLKLSKNINDVFAIEVINTSAKRENTSIT